MDAATNAQATRLLHDLANRYGYRVIIRTAIFTGGGEGYAAELRSNGGYGGEDRVVHFHNDDQYGPRWNGLAGRRLPGHKVIPYVNAYAENPQRHPQDLNYAVLDQAGR